MEGVDVRLEGEKTNFFFSWKEATTKKPKKLWKKGAFYLLFMLELDQKRDNGGEPKGQLQEERLLCWPIQYTSVYLTVGEEKAKNQTLFLPHMISGCQCA